MWVRFQLQSLCFLVASVLRLALMLYYQREFVHCPIDPINPTKPQWWNFLWKKFTISYYWRSGVCIVNFEHISHLFLVFLLLTLNSWIFAGNFPIYINVAAILQQVAAKYWKPYNKEKHWYGISLTAYSR